MVRVGILGIGFMGMTHFHAWQQVRQARVTAICTRDAKKRAGDWRGIQGNLGGPAGQQVDLKGIAAYADWHELLADPKVDLVDICLPTSLHAEAAVAALQAGKHVLCEKPLALEPRQAAKMTAAARTSGKLLMAAQVLPYFPEYGYLLQAARIGRYGQLLGGHFKRIISDPLWIKDFFDPRGAGGPVIDLHIHDAHFIRLLCGMPRAVFSTGRWRGEVVSFVSTQFLFDQGQPTITAASGVIDQQGRSFTHGFEVHFEHATLVYDFSVFDNQPTTSVPLTVLERKGKVLRPKLAQGDAFAAELADAARAVRTGEPPPPLRSEAASDALLLCHLQQQSVRRGKPVRVTAP
jgi:predicted dehydrogenase